MTQEDNINGRDDARGQDKRVKRRMVQEGIIKERDDAGGHYQRKGWCMRTLQKGIDGEGGGYIKGRHDAGGRYKRVKGRDGAGGHYKREG